MKKLIFPFVLFFIQSAVAQTDLRFYGYSYNHLDWFSIESEHFIIHFQEGNSRSAQVISRIAEEIYRPITELYEHEPDSKVSIVLKDREDYSNGAAFFFDNKIDIWIPALNTPLRGTHNWLRNVITHEFTHIVQIQSSMKNNRRYPATYVQWLNYEDVRRPDVLYGFPNGIATMPFAAVNVPAWLAEGTAQYQRASLTYDTWDAHRDMILRTRIMQSQALTLEQMGSFSSKTSLERETVYNHGFAFSIWLANRYGETVLKDISRALSQNGVQDVSDAIEIATGTSGLELHKQWVSELKAAYTQTLNQLKPETEQFIQKDGFFNFYPIKRPGHDQIAYLSNKGYDFGRLKLYFYDLSTGETTLAHTFEQDESPIHEHTMSCGHTASATLLMGNSPFTFSEDGSKVIYSRLKLNKVGEEYLDLFEFDLIKKKEKRLSFSARLSDPVLLDENRLVAITRRDGTQNLVIFNRADTSITPLTFYQKGEQVYSPDWNPITNEILFSYSDVNERAIKLIKVETGEIETLMHSDKADFRDAKWVNHGAGFVFSSNLDGIFNIYQYDFVSGEQTKLTNVIGGAFMPLVHDNKELFYASYQATGYKIAKKSLKHEQFSTAVYQPVLKKAAASAAKNYEALNVFDDTDLGELEPIRTRRRDEKSQQILIETRESRSNRDYYRYKDIFTQLSVFPIVRFDNYTTPNGSNGQLFLDAKAGKLAQNLWRDTKVGVYLASREVIDRLSIYAGAMFGLGSLPSDGAADFVAPGRLVDLDRDLFMIAEYQGLPFIKTHWSPTVSVELYNLRRNVNDGVSIEEFPCVSCLPDTTKADIAYDIWEADIFLRSKLNRFSMLELGFQYTPYQVTVNPFFSREYKQVLAASTSQYYIGRGLNATYYLNTDLYHVHDDVAPLGFRGYARYSYQPSELLDNYKLKDGLLIPVYQNFQNQSVEVRGRYGFKLGNQFLSFNARFFSYLNTQDEYFFLDYIGGLIGMRSYSFFALGGSTTAFGTLSWNVPLITHMNKQVNRFTLDKLFLRLFAEAGNGWGGPLAVNEQIKTGIGAELRFSFNTNYLFPTKFFISSSYGFNKYDLTLPADFITSNTSNKITYGREWLFHFGLLFDFEL